MRDRIAVLGDGHLTGHDRPRVDTLVSHLQELGRACAAIYILGDLFEVWLGVGRTDPARERVGRALKELRESGVKVAYVEGNRDFGIGRGATAGLFDEVAERELVARFGDATFHFSHGDLVNTRDRQYRAWRWIAKGILAPIGLRLLPETTAIALADRLEERLRTSNRRHKSDWPEAECVRFARRKINDGADVVIVGHFHRFEIIEVTAEKRAGVFVSLPFWHQEPRPLLFDRAGRLLEGEAGGDVPRAVFA